MDPYDSVEIRGFYIPYNLGMDSGFHALDSGFLSFTFTAFRVPSHGTIYNYLFCWSNSLTSQLNIIFHPCLTGHLSRLAPLVITCSLYSNLLYSSYNDPLLNVFRVSECNFKKMLLLEAPWHGKHGNIFKFFRQKLFLL